MQKTFYIIDILNIVTFYDQLDKKILNQLPLKLSWSLKRAVDKMRPDAIDYENVRDKELKKIQDIYFDKNHADSFIRPILDKEGNPQLDENGGEKTKEGLKIKEEYQQEYQKKIDELNNKLNPILLQQNTYEYNGYDIDSFVDSLPNDTNINFDILEKINIILGEDN